MFYCDRILEHLKWGECLLLRFRISAHSSWLPWTYDEVKIPRRYPNVDSVEAKVLNLMKAKNREEQYQKVGRARWPRTYQARTYFPNKGPTAHRSTASHNPLKS